MRRSGTLGGWGWDGVGLLVLVSNPSNVVELFSETCNFIFCDYRRCSDVVDFTLKSTADGSYNTF